MALNSNIHQATQTQHTYVYIGKGKGGKGKVIPLQARCGPEGG
jgi:hypothetical protein